MPAITVDALAADRGDALWIECHRPGQRPWRLLFDGGMPTTWPELRRRVLALDPADRIIDLAVVSHIDSDHIGGMLALLADDGLDVTFGDVWFNGLGQLPEAPAAPSRGVAEGESLVRLLSGGGTRQLPWNRAFGGRAAMTAGDAATLAVEQPGWPSITLLSPTPRRLVALRRKWEDALTRLRRGEPAEPATLAPAPRPLGDLAALAAEKTGRDRSATNRSSIAFLLEHGGASCLLTADASSTVLGAAATTLVNARGRQTLDVDLLQVSHHGSQGNVTSKLAALVPARNYVVSTNGALYHHPDDIALARVVTAAPAGARLWFNYATPPVRRWGDPALCAEHEYEACFPEHGAAGVRVEL